MKKNILCLSLLVNSLAFSQITLEHTYNTNGFSDNKGFFFNTENNSYYYTLDNSTNSMTIYTETHSLFKTVNLPVSVVY